MNVKIKRTRFGQESRVIFPPFHAKAAFSSGWRVWARTLDTGCGAFYTRFKRLGGSVRELTVGLMGFLVLSSVPLLGCHERAPLDQSAETKPADPEAPLVVVSDDDRLEVGRKLLRAGRLEEANVLFETVLQQRPELARASFYKGVLLQKRKSHSIALDWYQAALDSNQAFPERATLPYFMAWSAYHAGDADRARLNIDRFIADQTVVPRADAFFLSGLIHFDRDRLDEAERSFRRAIELSEASQDPVQIRDMTRAWVRHADVLARLGRDPEALISIERAIELNPDLMESWFRKYTILSRIGDEEAASVARVRWQQLRDQVVPSDPTGGQP